MLMIWSSLARNRSPEPFCSVFRGRIEHLPMQPVNHKISRLGLPKMSFEIARFADQQSAFPAKAITFKSPQIPMDQRLVGSSRATNEQHDWRLLHSDERLGNGRVIGRQQHGEGRS